jgi:hypothetical protein
MAEWVPLTMRQPSAVKSASSHLALRLCGFARATLQPWAPNRRHAKGPGKCRVHGMPCPSFFKSLIK